MNGPCKTKKRSNPKQSAGVFSEATFLYTLPLFLKGRKRALKENDVYETLKEHSCCMLGDQLESLWESEVQLCRITNKKPSLWKVLIKAFWSHNLLPGVFLFLVEVIIRPTQAIAIGRLVSYYSSTLQSKNEVYVCGAAIVLSSYLVTLLQHTFLMGAYNVGLKLKIACSSLIYRKVLKLKIDVFEKISSGQILTLVSNDSNRFHQIPLSIHYIWTGPIQTAVVTYLICNEFGISGIFGICFLLLFIPIALFLGRISKKLRVKTVTRTDERIRAMKEVISGIQVIKMYGWEKYFTNLVSLYRRMEIKSLRLSLYVKGLITSFTLLLQRTCVFITILAYVLLHNSINAEKAFILVCFYNTFRGSMISFFPRGISLLTESVVSINRLTTFLLYEETQALPQIDEITNCNALQIREGSVRSKRATADNILHGLNLNIKRGSLVAITGAVGSGKTSLLNVMLKESPLTTGFMVKNGDVSYAAQDAWLFTGSVRQNVLFCNAMQKKRYNIVLKVCALKHDLRQLPQSDLTVVGDRGASLSGGQKARINLARAVYKDADIYILDDPLSAVDARVGKTIFEECIQTFLQSKTVILVTHQVQYLQVVDNIFVLGNGSIVAEGTYSDLLARGFDTHTLLNQGSQSDEKSMPQHKLSSESIGDGSTESLLPDTTASESAQEQVTHDAVSGGVYRSYFTCATHPLLVIWIMTLFLITQVLASGTDYFLAYWVNLEQARSLNATFTSQATTSYIYVYFSIITGLIVFTAAAIISLRNLCMRSSIKLHDSMFASIINATFRFFHTNHSGRILNRFSKDMETLDEELPYVINDTVQLSLNIVGAIVLICTINYLALLPTVTCGIILFYLRRFYLSTSRSLKRLESATRSPVLGHINTTFSGLSTIRAFAAQRVVKQEFDNHQDLNSSVFFMYLATSRAFAYWVDLVCAIFTAFVIFLLLKINDENLGGNVGLTISQCLAIIGVLQLVVRQYSEMENCIISVERVLEYNLIEQESSYESAIIEKPIADWPRRGEIEFGNVSLRYSSNDDAILKDLNFVIRPNEKIGIVGRTGAGKSSLINALFRLSDFTGSITIDSIDITKLPLKDLRAKISIIPQDPVIFSGSIRSNLDPFQQYDDAALWKVLGEVELKDAVDRLTTGLQSEITEGGLNFSVGQRQLMCLARAILRNNKILVLDEATANVDPHTDVLIQKTVRTNFDNCTVLTIAHRLDTVMDSDKLLVMEDGSMVEFDHPQRLLQNPNSHLYRTLPQTGAFEQSA